MPPMRYIAVIDVETTGLNPFRSERIVEVGAMLMSDGGEVVGEFTSLVNPERDVGLTRIHGISAADVAEAPRFSEIAHAFAEFLSPASAIAGHNVRFDGFFKGHTLSHSGTHPCFFKGHTLENGALQ